MENKYYTPSVSEFYIGFEYERMDNEIWVNDSIKHGMDIHAIQFHLRNPSMGGWPKIRVKYLDATDVEELGINKSKKNQWIGWYDYYSGNVSGEYGYFLYYTLHFPRLFTKSSRLEDNLFKIILHRHYVSNEDETTNIKNSLEQCESDVVYIGLIKNKSELKRLLIQLGIYEKA